ncbi:hypothetical protein CsSME_00036438 [Camellia sinensis var. sinensis]
MNSTTMIDHEFPGHLYVKSDVYGFGVVLLELLTGLRVFDMNRPKGKHYLIEWARPVLPDKRKLSKIMDPGLENHYPSKAAFQAAELIFQCLESEPKNRPSMEEDLETLQQVNAIKIKPKGSKVGAKHTATATQRHQQDRYPPRNSHHYGHDQSLLHHQRYGGNGGGRGGARSPLPRPRC